MEERCDREENKKKNVLTMFSSFQSHLDEDQDIRAVSWIIEIQCFIFVLNNVVLPSSQYNRNRHVYNIKVLGS